MPSAPEAGARSGSDPIAVLIAGIGAGSLGVEIAKSLRAAGGYRLIGTDVAPTAYGHATELFDRTVTLPRADAEPWAEKLLELAVDEGVDAIAPGAGQTHDFLNAMRDRFESAGLLVMLNDANVIELCNDKCASMELLDRLDIPYPAIRRVTDEADLDAFDAYPCVVKPNRDSGGSNMVFVAEDADEARFFVRYIARRGSAALVQAYVDSLDEFTVGVLSDREGHVLGSVALLRSFGEKLSVSLRYGSRVVSSGWSQGVIDSFAPVRQQAEHIARAIGSRWALNIQGRRAADGTFLPFEINPRHSGTTYLRTLAGFNEPDILLQASLRGEPPAIPKLRPGHYLRAFTEAFLPLGGEEPS